MLPERCFYLLDRLKNDQISEDEMEELRSAVISGEADETLTKDITDALETSVGHASWTRDTQDEVWVNIREHMKPPVHRLFGGWKKFTVAAAVVAVLLAAGYNKFFKALPAVNNISQQKNNDVLPGGNRAVLTLANGSVIVLDSAQNGVIAEQGSTRVSKTASGIVRYDIPEQMHGQTEYNKLTTPRGGQYQLFLPDGTAVWLNAASSIEYPTAFTGSTREVRITGEAYFEVAHNAAMPFIVKTAGEEVRVLGTHFNINAYEDENSVKTTLLEGSISLKTDHSSVLLKPGEQARLEKNGTVEVAEDNDLEQVLAWKNGLFKLSSAELPDVLRQVSRWYDVTVVFEGGVPAGHLTGKVSRNLNLSEIVKLLEYSGFKIIIDGKNLIVKP
jgi:transmembrane sensor